MGRMKKLTALTISALLALSSLTACSTPAPTKDSASASSGSAAAASAPGASSDAAAPALDTSKFIKINAMMVGVEEPTDMPIVAEEINKLTRRDFNMEVNWIFVGLDNDKYNLKLTSGEQIDMCYTATWKNYGTNAKNGAFVDLTDLIPTYAPKSWETMDKQKWNEAKVDGKLFCVPSDETSYRYNGLMYRADLAKKFGITTPIKTWEDMDKYLAACKKEFPDILPITEEPAILANTLREMGSELAETIAGPNLYYAASKNNDTYEIYNLYEAPGFEQVVTIAQDWYNKGYWSKSILSNKTSGAAMFKDGLTFACKGNVSSVKGQGIDWQKTHPDWEVDIFLSSELKGIVHVNPSIANAIAIPVSSADPARTLAFIDKLRYDREYYDLTQYGIKDKHYKINDKGQVEFLGDNNARLFDMGTMGTGWYMEDMQYPRTDEWNGWEAMQKRLDPLVKPRKCDSFAFDPTNVAAQATALNQVVSQYAVPMLVGMSKDIKADITNLNEQLKKAGLEQYQAEVERQAKQYWQDMGY